MKFNTRIFNLVWCISFSIFDCFVAISDWKTTPGGALAWWMTANAAFMTLFAMYLIKQAYKNHKPNV